MNNKFSFYTLFLPWFILLFIFTLGFASYNFFISITDWRGIYPSYNLVGLENYLNLPEMEGFLPTILNTGILFSVGVPAALIIAVLVAISLDISRPKIASAFRTIAIVPMSVGAVIVAGFWTWMFNYSYGGINELLRSVGLDFLALDWLGAPSIALFAIIIMLVWKFAGYGALVILGGLQAVPESEIEAAEIDGASTLQTYIYVLLPQVKGHILTVTILLSMYMLKSFGYIWPLTGGGPGWSTTLFPVLAYRKMFEVHDFAGGAAAATFMFLIVAFIAVPYLKYSVEEI